MPLFPRPPDTVSTAGIGARTEHERVTIGRKGKLAASLMNRCDRMILGGNGMSIGGGKLHKYKAKQEHHTSDAHYMFFIDT